MSILSLSLWGDSIGKGILFDEVRGRYAIFRDNCLSLLSREMPFQVTNHAVMGCTAPQAIEKLTPKTMKPGGVAVIEFGGNDCDLNWTEVADQPDQDHLARTTLMEFKRSLVTMVDKVRASQMIAVLVTPPPLDAQRYFDWVSKNLDKDAILKFLGEVQYIYRWQERYACAVREVAAQVGSRVIDLRDAFLAERKLQDFLSIDGIHPNEKGYQLINRVVLPYVR